MADAARGIKELLFGGWAKNVAANRPASPSPGVEGLSDEELNLGRRDADRRQTAPEPRPLRGLGRLPTRAVQRPRGVVLAALPKRYPVNIDVKDRQIAKKQFNEFSGEVRRRITLMTDAVLREHHDRLERGCLYDTDEENRDWPAHLIGYEVERRDQKLAKQKREEELAKLKARVMAYSDGTLKVRLHDLTMKEKEDRSSDERAEMGYIVEASENRESSRRKQADGRDRFRTWLGPALALASFLVALAAFLKPSPPPVILTGGVEAGSASRDQASPARQIETERPPL